MHASFSEIIVILLVALLVIRPEHLPSVLQTVVRGIKWLRQAMANIKREIEESFEHE